MVFVKPQQYLVFGGYSTNCSYNYRTLSVNMSVLDRLGTSQRQGPRKWTGYTVEVSMDGVELN